MGKFIQLIREYVDKFQPRLESKLETELGKIEVIKNLDIPSRMKQGGGFNQDKTDILFKLEINEKYYKSYKRKLEKREQELILSPDKIIDFEIQTDTMHELAHMFQTKMMFNKMQQIKSKPHTEEKIKPFKQFFNDGYRFPGCFYTFMEGFANYMAYDLWSWIYDEDLKASRHIEIEKKVLLSGPSLGRITRIYGINHDPYYEGYKFFRDLGHRLEPPSIIELSTVLPKDLREIKNPDLYIQRILPSTIGVQA